MTVKEEDLDHLDIKESRIVGYIAGNCLQLGSLLCILNINIGKQMLMAFKSRIDFFFIHFQWNRKMPLSVGLAFHKKN